VCWFLVSAATGAETANERCLLDALAGAEPERTVAELRAACATAPAEQLPGIEPGEPIRTRLELEQAAAANRFAILAHRPNYVVLGSYNFAEPNEGPFDEAYPGEDVDLERFETKFQISLKVPVARELFGDNGHLYAAYTNRSFWQVANTDISRPFRETNHEPEAWLSFDNDWEFLGWRNALVDLGVSHQSNGRGGVLSRSWNRLYARLVFEHEDLAVTLKPWWRIPEADGEDDNPDIEDYLGNFELLAAYRHGRHSFSAMLRNNLDFGDNRGAVQLDWSFPLNRNLRGYVQWFNGYGESLIDYNVRVNTVGFGLLLTDWL